MTQPQKDKKIYREEFKAGNEKITLNLYYRIREDYSAYARMYGSRYSSNYKCEILESYISINGMKVINILVEDYYKTFYMDQQGLGNSNIVKFMRALSVYMSKNLQNILSKIPQQSIYLPQFIKSIEKISLSNEEIFSCYFYTISEGITYLYDTKNIDKYIKLGDKIASEMLQKDYSDSHNLKYIFEPQKINYSDEQLSMLNKVPNDILSHFSKTQESREFFCMGIRFDYFKEGEDEDVELKNFKPKNSLNPYSIFSRRGFFTLPIHTRKYQKYLMDLKISEIKKLVNEIPSKTSAENAIKISEKILESQEEYNEEIWKRLAIDTAYAIESKIYSKSHPYRLNEVHKLIVDKSKTYERNNILSLLKTLYDLESPDTTNIEYFNKIFNSTIYKVSSWFKGSVKNANFVIGEFMKVENNPKVIANIIIAAGENDDVSGKITEKLWINFIEKYDDEYRGMPAEWVVTLLHNERK